jgi:hypothetical protein
MCYNKNISIYTYIIGVTSCILLLRNDNPSLQIIGFFFFIAIQMQLIDYFLWSNNKCNSVNINISNVGSMINFIQPIMLYLAIIYFNKNIEKHKKTKISIVIFLYVLSLALYSLNLFPLGCSGVTKSSYPYLQWSWHYKKYPNFICAMFPISLTLLFYYGLDKPYNVYVALISIISFVISFIIYNEKKAFGNIWCWFSAFIPLCFILYDKYYDKIIKKFKNE